MIMTSCLHNSRVEIIGIKSKEDEIRQCLIYLECLSHDINKKVNNLLELPIIDH